MSTVVDLGGLGARGFIAQGGAAGDFAGWSVSSAGDVNGDGFDDVIVGALYSDLSGPNSGSAYVIYGKPGGFGDFNLTVANLTPGTGFIITSNAESFTGLSVSGAGDVNGDGFDDVIVGTFKTAADKAYVVFGKASRAAPVDLTNLSSSDGFAIAGPANAPTSFFYGPYPGATMSVSDAGDVNGDGFGDVIMGFRYANGNKGGAYVVFGKAGGFSTVDLTSLSDSQGFAIVGAAPDDQLGANVSGAGDINGDGFDDVIVGALYSDLSGPNSGSAYVIFGKANGFATVDVASLPASAGFMIQGDAAGDRAGSSVSDAGDINHDGFDDIIIGAPANDAGGTDAGAAYVIFGKATGFGTIDLTNLGTAGFIILGDAAQDLLGSSVSAAGDFNHDGFADVLVGASLNDVGGTDSGRVYVIFGKASGFGTIDTTNLDSAAGLILQGPPVNSAIGWSISTAGDINHDGFADVVLGTPFGGNNEGKVYVISGNVTLADVHNDFNSDGRSDILWRNLDSGLISQSLGQAGGGFTANPVVTVQVPDTWTAEAIGDFNGDGRDDILWRHISGLMGESLGQPNGGFAANPIVSVQVGLDWHIAGTADFNGDGLDDILWRHTSGLLGESIGQLNGGFAANPVVSVQVGSDWHVTAIGDFNGDGRYDILWRSEGGGLSESLGQPNGGFAANPIVSLLVSNEWAVAGTGDFNGDGFDDIVWRDGNLITESLGGPNGGFSANPLVSAQLSVAWSITAIGDYNGDGRDDLLLRNDNGQLVEWLGQSNGTFVANAAVNLSPATAWQVQDPSLQNAFL